jgi:hypothetical protein
VEKYPISSIFSGVAANVVAVWHAMSGEPWWVVLAWAAVGASFLCEVFCRAKWTKDIPKPVKIGVCILVVAIIGTIVIYGTRYRNIAITVPNKPDQTDVGGYIYVGVEVHNKGLKDASCKVYLTEFRKDGEKPLDSFRKTKLELAARNRNPGAYDPQQITVGDEQIFELFYIDPRTSELAFMSDQIKGRLPTPPPPFPPGKYMEKFRVSGINCGPLEKSVSIDYRGGESVTVEER